MTEWAARLTVLLLVFGLPLGALVTRWADRAGVVEVHAAMPEAGGWSPASLTTTVGEPLRLRLVSDDVMHGFAVGQTDFAPVDVKPGQVTEVTLTFDEPGTYTYYCTR